MIHENFRTHLLAVGAKLRAVRRDRGWSLTDVEEKSGGIWKAVVVGSYKRGDRAISAARLCELAGFYGVPPADLLPTPNAPQPTVPQLLRRALAVAEQQEALATYDTGAGWDKVADAMDRHGAAAVLADPSLAEEES